MRHPFLRTHRCLVCLATLTTATYGSADPALRTKVDQRGDFALIGNTLGWDCNITPAGVVLTGSVDCSGASNFSGSNTSADVYWRSEEPTNDAALASASVTMANARSTAMLTLPSGAVITYARLYWAALQPSGGTADSSVTLERPGNTNVLTATADDMHQADTDGDVPVSGKFWYQGTADVTDWLSSMGSGLVRVGGVSSIDALSSYDETNAMAGWSLVVFYSLATDPPRNLALFDGLDTVAPGATTGTKTATISGFLVPSTGFDAKLGVVAYEGDADYTGDSLSMGPTEQALTALSNALNPADNFFNSSHSYFGVGVSNAGDLPRLSGAADSMAGMDIDIIDLKNINPTPATPILQAGQTSAVIQAATATNNGEKYALGVLVTSISTFKPDFSSSGKTVQDVDGGTLFPGDVLEYTITVPNTGSDGSKNTILIDSLPTQVTYVPDSLELVSPTSMSLTDASGDDTGEYVAADRRIVVRLGAGASETAGGTMAIGDTISLKFQVTLNSDVTGLVENQAIVTAEGAQGAPSTDYPTDGNGVADGTPPTTIGIDSDSDGIPDLAEASIGTNPADADSDDDGVLDGAEPDYDKDSDGDGLINALDPDSDNDGLFDGTELGLGCDNAATFKNAARCIADADNGATKTDPLLADTDGGGVRDGSEDANLNGQVDSGETNPAAGQGADDDDVLDSDQDGLSDLLEATLGSNPTDQDSDDDGVLDGVEPNPSDDGDHDGLVDVVDSDSDDDGLYDGTELSLGCSDAATNPAAKQCIADADPATHTSALVADTDGGGVRDGAEDINHDGAVNGTETNPILGQAADDASAINLDTDGDGLPDALEATLCSIINSTTVCSDPTDRDSDDDGVPDGEEANPASDTDGDGIINVLDPDSDHDGLFDGTELGYPCDGQGTTVRSPSVCRADADSGATWTSPVNADTDRGGVLDGDEDENLNGQVDANERDPLNRQDDVWKCFIDSDCDPSITSGLVCSASHLCVNGCRGSGGNGCPTGQLCSSTTNAIGTCSVPSGAGGSAGAAGAGGVAGSAPATGGALATGGAATGGAVVAGAAGAEATGGSPVIAAAGADATGGTATGGAAPVESGGAETGGAATEVATGGTSEPVGDAENDTGSLEGSGCSCTVAGKNTNGQGWLLSMIAGLLWLRRKRSR